MPDNTAFSTLGTITLGLIVFAVLAVVGVVVLGGLGSAVASCPSGLTYNTSATSGTNACYGCLNTSYGYVGPLCTMGLLSNFTSSFIANITLSSVPIDAGSISIVCPNGSALTNGIDYSPDYNAGNLTMTDNPRSWTAENFTSLFDTNVSLWKATNNISYADSVVVYTCANTSEVWDAVGNYTLTPNYALMDVLSTGGMANDTVYCYNATGAIVFSGATCTAQWSNSTLANYANAPAATTTAFYMQGQLGNNSGGLASYTPALIAVAIGAIFIGLLSGFMTGRRNR
jgi:hypothetical protein